MLRVNSLEAYLIMLESTYSIKNGKVVIREIDKSRENELIDVVEINCSNVKKWYRDPFKKQGEARLDELDWYTIFLHDG